MVVIRASRAADGPALREIELLAGRRFSEIGMDDVAAHEPVEVDVLAGYAASGRSWVAVEEADEPVGFVLVDLVDGSAHVEELSVRPDHQGRGVGRGLLEHVRAWAAENGLEGVTLSTFSDVSWNRPLYEHRPVSAAAIAAPRRRWDLAPGPLPHGSGRLRRLACG